VLIVPTVELPPNEPPTYQPTVVLELPVTAAVNCCCPPAVRFAVAGVTVTATSDFVIVTVDAAEVVPFATAAAVTDTVGGVGTVAGAV
jgi:hypothetical protein